MFYGRCYHLDIIQKHTTRLRLVPAQDTHIDVFLHTKGIWRKAEHDSELEHYKAHPRLTTYVAVELEALEMQDYFGSPCNSNPKDLFDTCVINQMDKIFMDQAGCTSPFGLHQEICRDGKQMIGQLGRFAAQYYQGLNCSHPCSYMKVNSKVRDYPDQGLAGLGLLVELHNSVTVMTSQYSYNELSLLAEIGGYIGLLLGISLLQIFGLVKTCLLIFAQNGSCRRGKSAPLNNLLSKLDVSQQITVSVLK